jgi:hypothetical protein
MGGKTVTELLGVVLRDLLTAHPSPRHKTSAVTVDVTDRRAAGLSSPHIMVSTGQR